MMNKTQVRNSLLLLLTATIWGVAFVAQSVGMDYVGPFTFNMVRSLIGGIVLIPCIFLLGRLNSPEKYMQKEKAKVGILNDRASKADERKTLLKGGICCGILFSLATNIQQIGIQYTTVGRAGFITACYIVIVPILGMVFFHKKSRALIWGAVALALVGLYLLCMTDDFGIGKGDYLY